MHHAARVLTVEMIRRSLRAQHVSVGDGARLALRLLDDDNDERQRASAELLLELEQIDPLHPVVRSGADRVYAMDEDAIGLPGGFQVGSVARVLRARVFLASSRLTAAEKLLQQALAVDARDPVAKILLCRVKQAQGRLSESVRIGQQLAAVTNREPSALLELGRLYEASRAEPEMAACANEDGVPPVTAAYASLVRAFRLAAAGEADAAIALCDAVMDRHRSTERALYKLAAIEKAWIIEVGGRLDEAIVWLEELAGDPELMLDADRLMSLGRLYEARPGGVLEAIAVYERLLRRAPDLRLLGRIARLYSLAGDLEQARAYRDRHRAAFEQDVGEVRLEQLLWVAARYHVALADIERFSYGAGEVRVAWDRLRGKTSAMARRKLALLSLLARDRGAALRAFRELTQREVVESVDLAYLSELTQRAGDLDAAGLCLGESVRMAASAGARPDPLALASVLAASNEGGAPSPAIKALVRQPDRPWCGAALSELARQRPADPVAWRALSTLASVEGREVDARRHEKRAKFLEDGGEQRVPPGHALTAAVYHTAGERMGIVHELWVSRHRATGDGAGALAERYLFANVTDELRTYLLSIFDAAKKYTMAKFAHIVSDVDAYAYEFRLTNEDELSSGPSVGLAIALAVISLLLGRSLPGDVAFSGMVVIEGRSLLSVRRVGDADIKVHGALCGKLRRILLPAECRPDIDSSDLVPRAAASQAVVYVSDLDQALEAVFGEQIWLW